MTIPSKHERDNNGDFLWSPVQGASLDECGCQEWRNTANDELVAFTDAAQESTGPQRGDLPGLFQALPEIAAAAFVPTRDDRLPNSPHTQWLGASPLAALLYPPIPHAPLIVRRGALELVGPLRNVDAPIWDWVIRATLKRATIHALPADDLPRGRQDEGLPCLAPSRPPANRAWLIDHIREFSPDKPDRSRDHDRLTALRAGLYLWHDFLDESHAHSQSIEGEGAHQLGDYWHAIMHRREPDYSNSKYWFRRIGRHVLFRELRRQADAIFEQCSAVEADRWRQRVQPKLAWDPFQFVDLCEECSADEESELALTARRIQLAEMKLLLDLTSRESIAG